MSDNSFDVTPEVADKWRKDFAKVKGTCLYNDKTVLKDMKRIHALEEKQMETFGYLCEALLGEFPLPNKAQKIMDSLRRWRCQ